MVDLLIELTDIYYKYKQEKKRTGYSDQSFLNMSQFQKVDEEHKYSCLKRQEQKICNCCIDKCKLEPSETKQFKELKVVIRQKDLCNATKIDKGLENIKYNTVESRKSMDTIKELQINLIPLSYFTKNLNTRKNLFKNKQKIIKDYMSICNSLNNMVNITDSDFSTVNSNSNHDTKANSNHKNAHLMNTEQYKSIHFKNSENMQENNIVSISISNNPVIKKLRKREKKDYLELSRNSLSDKSCADECKKKVPIYRQCEFDKVLNKKDPYELDLSDLEQRSSKNKPARNWSEKFDKSIYEVLKKLEKKNSKIKKTAVLKKAPSYTCNIKSVMQRVMEKVEKNKIVRKHFNKPLDTGQVRLSAYHGQPQDKSENVQNFQSCDKKTTLSVKSLVHKTNSNMKLISNEDNFDNDDEKEPVQEYSSLCNEFHLGNGNCFGFDESDEQLSHSNNRIHIISNLKVKNSQKIPWRLNGLKHSNYVILYKKNALPCLDQEAVVNYNLSERIEESCSQNNSKLQPQKKSHFQTTILDYVESSHSTNHIYSLENLPENMFHHSLYEEFDTNLSTTNTKKYRTILGVIQDNILIKNGATSTPLMSNRPVVDISVINNSGNVCHGQELQCLRTSANANNYNFDFDHTISEKDLEEKDCSEDRPFRVSNNMIRNYKKHFKNKNNDAKYEESIESVPSVLINYKPETNSSEDIGIFDDVEPEFLMTVDTPIQFCGRLKRRQRLASESSEYSENEKLKKKRTNVMTNVEKEEYEKWAAQFNAMCSEIEKHRLEIE